MTTCFKADTTMSIGAHMQINSTVDIVVTAMALSSGGVEVLRVEAYDAETKTMHMLPEFLVDLLTGDRSSKEWLTEYAASLSTPISEEA